MAVAPNHVDTRASHVLARGFHLTPEAPWQIAPRRGVT